MNKELYFKQLVALFEETIDPQEKIADDGSDIEDENVLPEGQVDENEEVVEKEVPEEEEEAAEDGSMPPQFMTQEVEVPKSEIQKSLRLFDLFKNLKSYDDAFLSSLEELDLGLLDSDKLKQVLKYEKQLKRLSEKIYDYLRMNFNDNDYEKSLYAYILMRTEMLTVIKSIRSLLGVDRDEKKDAKNIK